MIFGIDLGTTNSLIARVDDGVPSVITDDGTGAARLPSVVHYRADGTILVGEAARDAGDGGITISSVKRLMALDWNTPTLTTRVSSRLSSRIMGRWRWRSAESASRHQKCRPRY